MTGDPAAASRPARMDSNQKPGHDRRSDAWRRYGPVGVIIGLGILLHVPALGWGLPGKVSWSQDTIAGVRTLGALEGPPGAWKGRYPPLHYLILGAAYKPILQHWESGGGLVVEPATGRPRLSEPQTPKITLLILSARVISAVMAAAAGLGLWLAARRLTGDNLAAIAAAVAMMIGAAFVYFAHLGNVDIPSMCWFAWSFYFYVRLLRSGHWLDTGLLGLFAALAISTKDAVAGVYPGMAVVLLVVEVQRHRGRAGPASSVVRAVCQAKWLLGLAACVLPYLWLYGVLSDPQELIGRLRYWLDPAADTLHARQLRYPDQFRLFLATIHYAAGGVGWPMLAAMACSAVYALRRHTRTAMVVLTPAVAYYLIVIAQIHFVYSRFLFVPLALLCIPVGVAGAALVRRRDLPAGVRLGLPSIVLALSLAYAVAINAEMLTDSRYQAEAWLTANVEPPSSVGAFSKPQYLPRFDELGYATYVVEMSREAFERPQPRYLVLTSYNYEDFDPDQTACMVDLLSGRLGYTPVATFRGRYLGTGSSWLSIAGWGTPTPGKVSPEITILTRATGTASESWEDS